MADKVKIREERERMRTLSGPELVQEVASCRASLYAFRRQNAMKQLGNTSAIRTTRRQIARALTILRERELAAQKEAK